ncbi:MAG: hypothetical protein U1F57_11585 [bacterium]
MFKSFRLSFLSLSFFLIAFGFSSGAWSYGPSNVNTDGTARTFPSSAFPMKWVVEGGPIQDTAGPNFSFDDACSGGSGSSGGGGGGGCSLSPWIRDADAAVSSNAEGKQIVQDAFNTWQGVADANVSFQADPTPLNDGGNTNICNVDNFIEVFKPYGDPNTDVRICGCISPKPSGCTATSCQSPIIFDTNGDIIAALLGEASRYTTHGSTIAESVPGSSNYVRFNVVINGACLEDSPDPACPIKLTNADMQGIILHELGHAIGLAHSQMGAKLVTGTNLNTGADPLGVARMFPYVVKGAGGLTLSKDDKMSVASLYPKPSLQSNYCTAIGFAFKSGGSALRCADMELTSTDPETITGLSGTLIKNNGQYNTSNFCTESNAPDCGKYVINGLVPGTAYKLAVNPINPSIMGVAYCGNAPSFTPVAPGGSFTCPTGGKTLMCTCPAPKQANCLDHTDVAGLSGLCPTVP